MNPDNEAAFAALVDQISRQPKAATKLVALLREQQPFYKDKNGNAITRMRGWVIYALSLTSLPDEGLLYIYEELASGREAYTLAAAAIALRTYNQKRPEMADLLVKALYNIRYFDNYVSFESYFQQWPLVNPTSAIKEILNSLQWLGAYALPVVPALESLKQHESATVHPTHSATIDEVLRAIKFDTSPVEQCCEHIQHFQSGNSGRKKNLSLAHILLEDQNGVQVQWKDFLSLRHTLLAFFYTRCDNPLKCSLTITKLADIQNRLRDGDSKINVNITAITYDPYYDTPERLKLYGEARGLKWDETTHIFRVVNDFGMLEEYFDLGVNYTGKIVNRHAVELFLLDPSGRIRLKFQREAIDITKIIGQTSDLIEQDTSLKGRRTRRLTAQIKNMYSLILPVFFWIMPKCPFCVAAYLSVLGVTSSQLIPYLKFFFPLLGIFMALNLWLLYKMGLKRNNFLPLYICILGSILVITFRFLIPAKMGVIVGLSLLFLSSILNSLPHHIYLRLQRHYKSMI